MSDVVISVEEVGKQYRVGVIGHQTLARDLEAWWAKLRGKEHRLSKVDYIEGDSPPTSDTFWALKNVSFEVKQGEILGIIGENGAGKSTLLKILSRITTPTTGRIRMKGRVASLLEVGTGFHPELTGRENIFLNGTILGMQRSEITAKFDAIIDFAGVQKFVDTPVKRYSSGMYVRLAFAVAAHLDPEILVVDEVLAVGDAAFREKCLSKMGRVAKEGRTVLFVSHNMAAVRTLCSRSIWLDHGKVVDSGDSSDVVDRYLTSSTGESTADSLPAGTIYQRGELPGSEPFHIDKVEWLDASGQAKPRLYTWDWVRIRIHYTANQELEKGSVGFQVFNVEQVSLMLCATQPITDVPLHIRVGSSFVDCVIPKWPLSAGEYQLGAIIAIPLVKAYFQDDRLCRFRVEGKDVYGSGHPPLGARYAVATEHFWELPN